jgi:hypothetical protein
MNSARGYSIRGYRGSLTASPSIPGGALRKANRGNEKRIYLKTGRYAQASQAASGPEAGGR